VLFEGSMVLMLLGERKRAKEAAKAEAEEAAGAEAAEKPVPQFGEVRED